MSRRMRLLLVGGALCLLAVQVSNLAAIEKKAFKEVKVDNLTVETQRTISTNDSMNLVWIIPIEFWQTSLAQDKTLTDDQRQTVIDALKKYTLVGIVRAEVSPLGAFRYPKERMVFDSISINVEKSKGENVALKLKKTADNDDAQNVIDSMKPLLKAAMGNMGNNFHLFVCVNEDADGNSIVSPYDNAKMTVQLAPIGINKGGAVEFNFPLDSLHVPRVCRNCQKTAHVSWSYCPFCGKKHE